MEKQNVTISVAKDIFKKAKHIAETSILMAPRLPEKMVLRKGRSLSSAREKYILKVAIIQNNKRS